MLEAHEAKNVSHLLNVKCTLLVSLTLDCDMQLIIDAKLHKPWAYLDLIRFKPISFIRFGYYIRHWLIIYK